jgi:hypothetical protein
MAGWISGLYSVPTDFLQMPPRPQQQAFFVIDRVNSPFTVRSLPHFYTAIHNPQGTCNGLHPKDYLI